MAIHIFWDNSNVWGALSNLRVTKEPDVPWYALRAYFKNIYDFAAKGRDANTKVMAGSVPPECEELWDYARNLGFETDLLKRVESDESTKCEQAVDEILHMKIANAILDYEPPQTLVILSGDSSISDYNTSFPSQIERAIKHGWDVEIYTSTNTISKTKYQPLLDKYPGKIKIAYFDNYYYKLTFVKEGEYWKINPDGTKAFFHINKRIVEKL